MGRHLLRHGIVGSETGQPRPPAYMRRGRTRRSRAGHPRRGRFPIASLLLIAAGIAAMAAFWPLWS